MRDQKQLTKNKAELDAYLVCALWASTDDKDEPLDQLFDVSDIDPESREKLALEFWEFVHQAEDLDGFDNIPEGHLGHNFWLNRNGHGSGFWDRDYLTKEQGQAFSKLSHKFGEAYLYVGDDSKIHLA